MFFLKAFFPFGAEASLFPEGQGRGSVSHMTKPPKSEKGSLPLGDATLAYSVERSPKRRRSMALYLQPEGGVRILAPARASLDVILDFVRQRAGWIFNHLPRAKPAPKFVTGEILTYRGAPVRLEVTQDPTRRHGVALRETVLEINIPHPDLSPKALREEVQLELTLWYKKQARREFQERLAFWAERLGVTYGRVILTNATRRWGSCNARNDIRLNWKLITLEPEILDYVAAHELCHVRHKNHARPFWRFLASVMPDWQERRRRLRAHEISP